jgi:peptide/nickel transport system permease protein/peptide/nickel transport system substrate-binding protein
MTGSACLQAFDLHKQFPAWQGAFSGRPDPFLTYQQNFGSTGQYNLARMAHPGVDAMLDKILSSYSREEQKPLFDGLNKAWIENAPFITLFYRPNYAVYSQDLAGEQPNLQGKPNLVTIYFKARN